MSKYYKGSKTEFLVHRITSTVIVLIIICRGLAGMFVPDFGMVGILFSLGFVDLGVLVFVSYSTKFAIIDFEIEGNILKCYKRKKLKSQHNIINSEFSIGKISNPVMLRIHKDGVLVNEYPIQIEIFDDIEEDINAVRAEYSGDEYSEVADTKQKNNASKILKRVVIIGVFVIIQVVVIYVVDGIRHELGYYDPPEVESYYTEEEIDAFIDGFGDTLEEYQEEQKRKELADELDKALDEYEVN